MKVRKLKRRLRICSYTFSSWVKPRDGQWQHLVHSFSRMSPIKGRPGGSTV